MIITWQANPEPVDAELEGAQECVFCGDKVGITLHGDEDRPRFTPYVRIVNDDADDDVLCEDDAYWIGERGAAILVALGGPATVIPPRML